MKRTMDSLLLGTISGLFLCTVDIACFQLAFPSISDKLGPVLFCAIPVLGAAIAIGILFIRNASVLHALLRWIVMLASYILFFIVTGVIGTVPNLHKRLGISMGEPAGNATGMLSVMLFLTVFFAGGFAVLIWSIEKRAKQVRP